MSITITAEVGCIHLGKIDRAKYLIDLAVKSGADIVKFQKRNPIECVPKELQNKPHPHKEFAYGKTYLEHRQNLEFSIKQHAQLKEHCEKQNVIYSTSVWDLTSAKEVISLNPKVIKIPSACNLNFQLLEYIYSNFLGEVHLSLGMTNWEEKLEIKKHIKNNTIIYHCVSLYPCPIENLYLNEIAILKRDWKHNDIGFSNHGLDINTDIAALALGATYFERHFTDSRQIYHTDSKCSLEPHEFAMFSKNLRNIEKSLKFKPDKLSEEELNERKKLRF